MDCRRASGDKAGRQGDVRELEHSLLKRGPRVAEFDDRAKEPDPGQRYQDSQCQAEKECAPLGGCLVLLKLLLGRQLGIVFRRSRFLLKPNLLGLAPCLDENLK